MLQSYDFFLFRIQNSQKKTPLFSQNRKKNVLIVVGGQRNANNVLVIHCTFQGDVKQTLRSYSIEIAEA